MVDMGSTEKKKGRGKVLSWEVRYKVAMGIAHAVEYLHFGTDRCVIHRDIKPSNILLTSNNAPKVSCFLNLRSLRVLIELIFGLVGLLS